MRKTPFVNDNYYHVYNRGVDKRQIFMDDGDRYRFLHDLYEFNDENLTTPFIRRVVKSPFKLEGGETAYANVGGLAANSRVPVVQICCFCLMPNHFHMLIKQVRDGGISLFMQKLGGGYTCYFNQKYERTGVLFQGLFKSKHIDNDAYLTHLSKYIHLNPVDLAEPAAARDFLKEYKWSSFRDYIGEKNYPSLIEKDLIMDIVGGEKGYEKFAFDSFGGDFENIKNYIINEG